MARRNSYSGKYKLSKHEYLNAYYYAMRYLDWKAEYGSLSDNSKAITYTDMPHGNGTGDPTAQYGERRAELALKMQIIEETANEADPDLSEYILYAATHEGVTFESLQAEKQIPCGRAMFYERRRKFYYLLNKKI